MPNKKRLTQLLLSATILSLPILLSGCLFESSSSGDPKQRYYDQQLTWTSCDPNILYEDLGEDRTTEALDTLGDRLQCTFMKVPVHHADPSKGDFQIAVMRTRAAEQRTGNLFFNPGGPGGDGFIYSALYGLLWKDANPQDNIGAQLHQLQNQYDLIGFSPRGTGFSSTVSCSSNERQALASNHETPPDNAIEIHLKNAEIQARNCQKNPLMRYINTEETVQDMDMLRHLLGDKKLNFIGYSYGTWLGAWYASRFPQNAGRMLLDSNMDFSANFDSAFLDQAYGNDKLLNEFLAPYAANHNAVFQLGDTTEKVQAVFPSLSVQLQDLAQSEISSRMSGRKNANDILFILRTIQVLDGLYKNAPGLTPEEMYSLIETTHFLPGEKQNEEAIKEAKRYVDIRNSDIKFTTTEVAPADATYYAVACNDTPTNTSRQFWIDSAKSSLEQYPFRGNSPANHVCLFWGGATTTKPPLERANYTDDGILLLQSVYDPATPLKGARSAFEKLSNARLIVVENESTHGLFPYGTECVDIDVGRYLNEGLLPSNREKNCPAIDFPAPQPRGVATKSQTYMNPEESNLILDIIKNKIGHK